MAFTSASLYSTIQGYLQQYDTSFTALLPTIVQQAEDRVLKTLNIPAFKQNSTATLVPNNRLFPAPYDMESCHTFTINNNGTFTPLIYREPSVIYEMWGNDTVGAPRYYSMYNATTFLLGPTPDQAYPVEFQYFYQPPSITTANTSWIGTFAPNVLLYACLVEAYTYMKGEQDLQQTYERAFQKALNDATRLGEGLTLRDSFTDNEVKVPVPR